jgi:hypothetical protein
MLSTAKHLAFSACYKVEILRLRLRMTLRNNLDAGKETGAGWNDWNELNPMEEESDDE